MTWLRRLISRLRRRRPYADLELTARQRAERIALLELRIATAQADAADAERRASVALAKLEAAKADAAYHAKRADDALDLLREGRDAWHAERAEILRGQHRALYIVSAAKTGVC